MLARLLYLIILTFLARLVFRAASEWLGIGGGSQARGPSARPVGDRQARQGLMKGRMVRDPVCGLNLPEDRAIVSVVDGTRQHFCSERCRDRFTRQEKRAGA